MQLNLQTRTILPVITILIVIMAGLAIYNYEAQVSVLNENAEATLRSALNAAQQNLDSNLNAYQQLATMVATNPYTEAAFAKGDRKALLQQYGPAYKLLKERFALPSIKFDYPPATNFVRIHQPETYGDDQAQFRHTLVTTNTKHVSVRGIEVGKVGIALRGVEPISYNGKHIGSVEFGGDLGAPIEATHAIFNVDVAVLISKQKAALAFEALKSKMVALGSEYLMTNSTNPERTQKLITPAILAEADSKLTDGSGYHVARASYAGNDYFIAIGNLKDFSGATIGHIAVMMNQTAMLSKIRTALFVNIVIYLAILILISVAINYSLKKTVIGPVINLTRVADDISMGKLSEKIEVTSNDEISKLAKSIDRLRQSVKKLLE
jgi:methyl-accepting chemotaxis protein